MTTTLTRLAALLGVVALVGWGVAIGADLASTVGSEPWIRVIQLVTLTAALGAIVAMIDVRRGWPVRGVAGRIGSVLVAIALVDLAWFAIAFRLLSISVG